MSKGELIVYEGEHDPEWRGPTCNGELVTCCTYLGIKRAWTYGPNEDWMEKDLLEKEEREQDREEI